MAATFTAAGYLADPRVMPGGIVSHVFSFSYGGRSASVSDVIYIGRLMNGVRVIDAWLSGNPGANATPVSTTATSTASPTTTTPSPEVTWKVGVPGNDVFFARAGSITTSALRALSAVSGYPKTISLSADGEGLLYRPIIVTRSVGTSTVTGSILLHMLIQGPLV